MLLLVTNKCDFRYYFAQCCNKINHSALLYVHVRNMETVEQDMPAEEPGPDLSINVAYQCAMKGSVTRFLTCFESEEDPYHEVG